MTKCYGNDITFYRRLPQYKLRMLNTLRLPVTGEQGKESWLGWGLCKLVFVCVCVWVANENDAKSLKVLTYFKGTTLHQVIDDTSNIKMRMRTGKRKRGRSFNKYF